jgi:hypothetical protein
MFDFKVLRKTYQILSFDTIPGTAPSRTPGKCRGKNLTQLDSKTGIESYGVRRQRLVNQLA